MLKEYIIDAWHNAQANGDEAELRKLSPFQLAIDMRDKDAFIETYPFGEVLIAVIAFVNNDYK